MNASPQADQQLTDERLEVAIEATRQAMLAAKTPGMRHELNGQMTRLIAQRSPEQIAKLEHERGLAITPAQQRVLDFITTFSASNGFPPTRSEIANALGFRSANAAEDHLRALARRGAVELVSGAARGIRIPQVKS